MRARCAGVDKNIGPTMWWKLVDNVSGAAIYRSTTCLAIGSDISNPQVDPIQTKPEADIDDMLDEFIVLADFDTSFLCTKVKDLISSIRTI